MFYKKKLEKISVIVPAYNVEDYIEYCLESIVEQEHSNLEVIVVDDGSDDLTPEIVDFWQEQYPEIIKVMHISHSGVGAARNVGLEAATGDYIAFVDSDDQIHKSMYKEMLKVAEKDNADIVICDVLLNEERIGGKKIVQYSINYGEFSKENYLRGGINLCSPCNKLFQKHVFDGKRFECITYEDMALIPTLVSRAKTISYIKKHYYYYKRRYNSITTKELYAEDLYKAIKYSIKGVKEEHRNLLSYWHAKGLIDLANGERHECINELELLLGQNLHLFLNNNLIKDNPYTEKIIYGQLVQSESCAEISDMSFTVISDLEQQLIFKQILRHVYENVQVLSSKEIKHHQIKGKYVLCIDEYVELPEGFISSINLLDSIYGNDTYVFAVPKKKTAEKSRIINIEKKPESINLDNYILIVNSEAFKKQKIMLSYNKREILYYALLKKKNIYIQEQLWVQPINLLENELTEDELFYKYQQIAKHDIRDSIQCCMALLMSIPHYIQYFIMMDIRKLVEKDYSNEIVNTYKFIEYKSNIQYALSFICDDIIQRMQKVTPEHMLFYFNMKYQEEASLLPSRNGLALVHNGRSVYFQDNTYTMFEFCDYENGKLRLEGRTICLNIKENEEILFFAVANDKIIEAKKLARNVDKYCLGEILYKGIEFEVHIPIEVTEDDYKIRFFYMYRGRKIARQDIRFGKFFPLTTKYKTSYYQKDDRILTYNDEEKTFSFHIWGRRGRIWKEREFLSEIEGKFSKQEYKAISRLRKMYYLRELLPLKKKRIWIISDKMSRGDDNGEAFFRYMNSTRGIRKKVKTYFLMDKKSYDYSRLKKIGKIVQYNSFKHKWLSLICEYHFIAYANDAVTKPLLKYNDCFKDIMRREWIVFLQHGPTQNNISSALNKYNQNFKAIVTINEEERNSFVKYNYYYRDNQIKLTGFSRYDYLKNTDKKYITFAPTWRRKLFGEFISQEERYVLKKGFRDSDYYKFYSGIINSPILRETLNKKGYELHFIPHPVFFPYVNEFSFGSDVVIHGVNVSYNQMFCDSSMFITDYSSAVFDCAYLMKPVIYTQFDAEDFYKSQYERGMFDYEEEGFGPVVDSVETAVKKIVEYLNNDCRMEEMYKVRVSKYFKYRDNENAHRIFDEFY